MTSDKLIKYCDQAGFYCFVALIFFLPIAIPFVKAFSWIIVFHYLLKRSTILYSKGDDFPSQSFFQKITSKLVFFRPRPSVLNRPIFLYITFAFLSVLFSQYFHLSIKAFFTKLLQGVFMYFCFVEFVNSQKKLKIFISVFFVSAILVTINGFFQALGGEGFVRHRSLVNGRIRSSFKHPNDLAAYLIFVSTLAFSCLVLFKGNIQKVQNKSISGKGAHASFSFIQWCLFILLLYSTFNLGFSFSRGAWISFFLSLAFLGYFERRTLAISLVIACLFFVIFFPNMMFIRNVSFISDNVSSDQVFHKKRLEERLVGLHASESVVNPSPDGEKLDLKDTVQKFQVKVEHGFYVLGRFKAMGRMKFWLEALTIIKDYPIFGAGLNTYSAIAKTYDFNWGGWPHNCFLQMTAELGILGLLSFLWIIYRFFRSALDSIRKIEDNFLYAIFIGLFIGVFGFLTHSFIDTNLYSVQLSTLFWIMLGAVVSVQQIAAKELSTSS